MGYGLCFFLIFTVQQVEEVFEAIEGIIGRTFGEVADLASEKSVTHRTAAQISAVSEVVGAMRDRGWL